MANNKKWLTPELENVCQGYHLQKSLSYYANEFYAIFIEMMAMWPATKMTSADLENIGQVIVYKNHISAHVTNFNQTFTEMMQLGLVAKATSLARFKKL